MNITEQLYGIQEPSIVNGELYAASETNIDQLYNNARGTYSPNHITSPAKIGIHLHGANPNVPTTDSNGKEVVESSAIAINGVVWYLRPVYGNAVQITSSDSRFVINSDNTLTVKYNCPVGMSGSEIICEVHYTDPVTGEAGIKTLSRPLQTTLSTVTALSLIQKSKGSSSYSYVKGDNYVLNPLESPNDKDGTKWKRGVCMQLCDGLIELPNAHDAGTSKNARYGSAFYFWSYIDSLGVEHDLNEDVEWFDGEQFPDGSFSPDCVVDLAYVQRLTLVCNAGFIPYGETSDYVDETGKVLRSKCVGYLRRVIKLSVHVPVIQHVDIVPIAMPVIAQRDLKHESTLNAIINLRRLVVKADGLIVNELTNPNTGKKDMVDTLFDVRWYDQSGTQVGTGEVLKASLANLGCTSTSNIRQLPKFSAKINQRFDDLFGNNYAVEMDPNGDNPIAQVCHGNPEFLNHLDFVIFDTTDNVDDSGKARTAYPAHKLMRNNLFRYVSGDYAPVVGITEDMEKECSENTLYSDSACTSVAYAKGAYDARTEWETADKPLMKQGKLPRTLYKKDASGNISAVSHKLRPWETTETKYSIGVGYVDSDVYFLDNKVGKSGKKWKGIFTDVTEWDGIDLKPYKLPATVISPGAFTTVANKARDFFYLYRPSDTNAQGVSNGSFAVFNEDRAYPRHNDVSEITSYTYCRANNKDTNSPLPMCEGGYFTLDAFISFVELANGTQYLHGAEKYGSGISSNDAVSASNFFQVGGLKVTKASNGSVTYERWGDSRTRKVGGTSYTNHWSITLNGEAPKAQCMEAQLAASMATELGIAATTASGSENTYYMYGSKYYYMDVAGAGKLADGYMNARVYKIIPYTYTDDNDGKMNLEIRLRMSLYAGAELAGDILRYCGGGAELVATILAKIDTNLYGNTINFWLQPDQAKFQKNTQVTVSSASVKFGFEDSYIKLIDGDTDGTVTTSNSWRKKRKPYTPFATDNSTSTKGDDMYIWNDNWYNQNGVGQKTRLALRFGLTASAGLCAPRSLYCSFALSHAARYFGGRAQARVSITQ